MYVNKWPFKEKPEKKLSKEANAVIKFVNNGEGVGQPLQITFKKRKRKVPREWMYSTGY